MTQSNLASVPAAGLQPAADTGSNALEDAMVRELRESAQRMVKSMANLEAAMGGVTTLRGTARELCGLHAGTEASVNMAVAAE